MTNQELPPQEREPQPRSTALLFPGQGLDPSVIFPYYRRLLAQHPLEVNYRIYLASVAVGERLRDYLTSERKDVFEKTSIMQPVVYTLSTLDYEIARKNRTKEVARPQFVAGHSLGEYAALTVADVFRFEDGIKIVAQRGRLMQEASERFPSGQVVMFDTTEQEANAFCQGTGASVALVNAERITVIGGDNESLADVIKRANKKRARRLNTAGAFHTPLMRPAAQRLSTYLRPFTFADPKYPLIANLNGRPVESGLRLKRLLVEEMTRPVYWTKVIETMRNRGVEVFVEIGPGNYLQELNKLNGISDERTIHV